MKHKAKRIVSAICALALCAAMLPVQAFAAPEVPGSSVVEPADSTTGDTTLDTTPDDTTAKQEGDTPAATTGRTTDEQSGSAPTSGTTPETTTGDTGEGTTPAAGSGNDEQGQTPAGGSQDGTSAGTDAPTMSPFTYDVAPLTAAPQADNTVTVTYKGGSIGDKALKAGTGKFDANTIVDSTNGEQEGVDVKFSGVSTGTYTVMYPTDRVVKDGNTWYKFTGWNVDGVEGQSFIEIQPGDVKTINLTADRDVTLTAKWENAGSDMPSFDGDPITIEVYLDGVPLTNVDFSANIENPYIDFAPGDNTARPDIKTDTSSEPYITTYAYTYNEANCADLEFSVKGGYYLLGVEASLVYGSSGSNGVTAQTSSGGVSKIDNIKNDTTVKLYLATRYSVEYYVDDQKDGNTDTNAGKYYFLDTTELGTSGTVPASGSVNAENANPWDGTQAEYPIRWKNNSETDADTIELRSTGSGVTGWFKDSSCSTSVGSTATSLELGDILAEGSGFDVDVSDRVITLYGTRQQVELAKILKEVNGTPYWQGATIQAGDVLTYEVTVENKGQTTLPSVTVTDTFEGTGTPGNVTGENGTNSAFKSENSETNIGNKIASWVVTDLGVGVSKVYTYTYTVLQSDEGKKISNTAVAKIGENGPSDSGTTEVEVGKITITKTPVLKDDLDELQSTSSIIKENGPFAEIENINGKYVTYTTDGTAKLLYKVTVTGFDGAEVKVSDIASLSTEYKNCKGQRVCSRQYLGYQGNVYSISNWSDEGLTFMMQDTSITLYFSVSVTGIENSNAALDAKVPVDNKATLVNGSSNADSSKSKISDEAPEVTIISPAKVIGLDKKVTSIKRNNQEITLTGGNGDGVAVQRDDEITYTITVTNKSSVALSNVNITDTFNGSVAPTNPGEANVTGNWTNSEGNYTLNATIASIAKGKTATITYTYTVQEADVATDSVTTLTNTVVAGEGVTCDPTDKGDTETKNPVERPAIDVEKEGEAKPDGANGGMNIDYTITVTNTGNSALTKVELTDKMFAGLSASKIKATVGNDGLTAVITKNNGGEIVTITFNKDNESANLPVGGKVTITYTYAVPQDAKRGEDGTLTVSNTVNVTATTEYGSTPTRSATKETEVYSGTVTMQPADITIYMGGTSGYEGVVDESGSIVASGNGSETLPIPGFYFTLPENINNELNDAVKALNTNAGDPADLSQYITVTAMATDGTGSDDQVARTWTLVKYGANESAAMIGDTAHFIYKIVPSGNQPPIRMQFTDSDGNTVTSDNFTISDALYQEYTMSLYLGGVQEDSITFKITIPAANGETAKTYYCGFEESADATLTVRHTTEDATTTPAVTDLADAVAKNSNGYYVKVADGQKFYINQKDDKAAGVDVAHDRVSLLVDDIISGTDGNYAYVSALYEKAVKAAGFASNYVDSKYLDLVDAENGNAWLTPDGEVTVFWPYTGTMNKNSNIKLYHFEGLDRDMKTDAVMNEIANTPATEVTITKYDDGFTFTTSSFSPFVLVQDTTQPSGGNDGNSGNNDNNTTTPNQTTTVTATANASAPAAAAPAATAVPQTSDDMPLGALTATAVAAAAAFVALLVVRKRRQSRD